MVLVEKNPKWNEISTPSGSHFPLNHDRGSKKSTMKIAQEFDLDRKSKKRSDWNKKTNGTNPDPGDSSRDLFIP